MDQSSWIAGIGHVVAQTAEDLPEAEEVRIDIDADFRRSLAGCRPVQTPSAIPLWGASQAEEDDQSPVELNQLFFVEPARALTQVLARHGGHLVHHQPAQLNQAIER